ncbi:MAG: RNA polymerase sigma factor [Flavobacteriales bacterium]|jgi:RNA polymerase sigma-70 factor (ECF subfamily)
MSDQELVSLCRNGNREAQKELFGRYAGKMMTVCRRYFSNKEEAEDILQEGFIKVFERLHQWQGTGALGGWIRTVMVNTALTHIRSQKKWKDTIDIEHADQIDAGSISGLEQLQAEEILAIIDQMPTGYRTVFNLFAVEGYGHKEIGEMLGISENTSKTQFLKSKEWLKKTLAEQEKYFG